jgi:hypothetical protein
MNCDQSQVWPAEKKTYIQGIEKLYIEIVLRMKTHLINILVAVYVPLNMVMRFHKNGLGWVFFCLYPK